MIRLILAMARLILAVAFVVLIAGLGGVVLRTSDGGRTWTYEDTGWKQAFFSVSTNEGISVAVGEKGLIRYSQDGGSSWKMPTDDQFPTIFTFMRDIDFAPNATTGVIVGQGGRVLRTSDAGHVWKQVLPPPSV